MDTPVGLNLPGISDRAFAATQVDSLFKHSDDLFLIAEDVKPLLTDYFLLMDALEQREKKETSFCFHDYGFVIQSVQKALESFITVILKQLRLPVSFKIGETIGSYLLNEEKQAQVEQAIDKFKNEWKPLVEVGVVTADWMEQFKVLGQQWRHNRNPQTHMVERIESLMDARMCADAIIRHMQIAATVYQNQFFGPLFKTLREIQREKKEQESREAGTRARALMGSSEEPVEKKNTP